MQRLNLFTTWDFVAFGLMMGSWVILGFVIEKNFKNMKSVTALMEGYRREWMTQMITREPRIFDSQILMMIRQGTSFFASASMIAIGGCLALLGNTEQLMGIAQDLTLESAPSIVWDIKLLVVTGFLANAFLKFVWANRLFGYCAVLMGAVPNDVTDPLAAERAAQAANINISGARSFNRGLRSVYYALAACGWLLGPGGLIVTTVATTLVLLRREFTSQSQGTLMRGTPGGTDTQA